ncbi:MAG: c-type cytochrome, partial [Chloroflexi bacterium]|nr:c-type cytochrome [Chloroflexota bacterium]
IETTISRGRRFDPPRYSMPAWARSEGGPLSPWQVKQLADLIMYGTEADWADLGQIRQQREMPVAEVIPPPPAIPTGADQFRITCAVCHTADAGKNSPNPLAPNLAEYATKGPLNDQLKAVKASGDLDWLTKWVVNPPSIKPGTAMPPYGASAGGTLNDEQVKRVVDYLLGRGK